MQKKSKKSDELRTKAQTHERTDELTNEHRSIYKTNLRSRWVQKSTEYLPWHCGRRIFWTHQASCVWSWRYFRNQYLASNIVPWSAFSLYCQYPWAFSNWVQLCHIVQIGDEWTSWFASWWWFVWCLVQPWLFNTKSDPVNNNFKIQPSHYQKSEILSHRKIRIIGPTNIQH